MKPDETRTPRSSDGRAAGPPQFSAIKLLAALAILFVSAPFVQDMPHGDLIDAVMVTLVMGFAVLTVGSRRRTFIVASLFLVPALAGKWANYVRPDLIPALVFLIPTIAFFAFVIGQLLQFVMRSPRVDTNILCAGLSGYLMLGLAWVPAYMAVAHVNPAAFALTAGVDAGHPMDGFHAFYFSFITLCTVGYGDVTPVSKVARMLAVTEAIAGLFYVAVLISRLVAVYSTTQLADEPGGGDET